MRLRITATTVACLVGATTLARAQAPVSSAAPSSCVKLEKDERRSVDPTIELALASCYGLAGRTGSALLAARRAADVMAASGDHRVDQARLMEAQFEARAPRLRIIVSQLTAGMTVTRNGEQVLPADWGIDVPIDPGAVQVDAEAPGRRRWSGKVVVQSGQKSIVVPALEPVAKGPAPARASRESPASGSGARTAAWISGALGVTGIGVGAVYGIMSMVAHDEANAHCGRGPSQDLCDREGIRQNQLAMDRGNVATGAFVAGGALLGLGVALWLGAAEPDRPGTARSIRLAPRGHAGGAGAELRGTF